jgi:hypothetical protein
MKGFQEGPHKTYMPRIRLGQGQLTSQPSEAVADASVTVGAEKWLGLNGFEHG